MAKFFVICILLILSTLTLPLLILKVILAGMLSLNDWTNDVISKCPEYHKFVQLLIK